MLLLAHDSFAKVEKNKPCTTHSSLCRLCTTSATGRKPVLAPLLLVCLEHFFMPCCCGGGGGLDIVVYAASCFSFQAAIIHFHVFF